MEYDETANKETPDGPELISMIVHELRAPLTTIKGLAHLISRRWDQLSQEKREWALASLVAEVEIANRLLENIDLVAKVDAGDIDVRTAPLVVQEIVEKAVERFDQEARDRIEMVFPSEPAMAVADGLNLEGIVVRLLDNGLRFSPEDTGVVLEVSETGESIRITVSDRGPGFTDVEREHLFEMFGKSPNPSKREKEGAGLGLFVAKSLALAMGCDLELDPRPGEGATFHLIVPKAGA